MKSFPEALKLPLNLYFVLWLLVLAVLLITPQGDFLLWLNQQSSPTLDLFFRLITYLGDGIIFGALLIIMILFRFGYALITLVAVMLQTFVIQGFKHWLFTGFPRPIRYFDESVVLDKVEGVVVHSWNSFPSGHTATGFAVAFLLILFLKSKWWGIILLLLAILVGLSRIYLLQHFLIDTWFGSMVGILSAMVAWYLFASRKWFYKETWQRGLIKRN